jgi:hypothetical protein
VYIEASLKGINTIFARLMSLGVIGVSKIPPKEKHDTKTHGSLKILL